MSDLQRIAHVGTYPPTKCGIATFTQSLVGAITANDKRSRQGVVTSVDEAGVSAHPPEVVGELVADSIESRTAAASALAEFDVVILQHEFGIFGGPDGDDVLDLVSRLDVPLIVVPHTVPSEPTYAQQEILEQLCSSADAMVALSAVSRTRLVELYGAERRRVRHIPHGATLNLTPSRPVTELPAGRTVLTWGLIGPGKGIEWGIEAMAYLRDLDPRPRYVVLGQTHPKVLRTHGEHYRETLIARAHHLGVRDLVTLEDRYSDPEDLLDEVRRADVVLIPYESRDQIVSGVLTDAIASGKPVVATRFPHAVELLTPGSGLLVPHSDAEAIAAALRSIFTSPGVAAKLESVAREEARSLSWSTIGRAYRTLVLAVVSEHAGVAR
jgi:glycosyltransferase involved in cell wall biosynthesis